MAGQGVHGLHILWEDVSWGQSPLSTHPKQSRPFGETTRGICTEWPSGVAVAGVFLDRGGGGALGLLERSVRGPSSSSRC